MTLSACSQDQNIWWSFWSRVFSPMVILGWTLIVCLVILLSLYSCLTNKSPSDEHFLSLDIFTTLNESRKVWVLNYGFMNRITKDSWAPKNWMHILCPCTFYLERIYSFYQIFKVICYPNKVKNQWYKQRQVLLAWILLLRMIFYVSALIHYVLF